METTCSHCGGTRHAGAPPSGCFIALRTLVADQMRAWQERVGRLEDRGGFTEIGEAVLRQTRTFSRLLNWLGIEFPGDPQEHRLPNLLKEGYIDRQYRAMAKLEVDAAERERFRDGVEAGIKSRIDELRKELDQARQYFAGSVKQLEAELDRNADVCRHAANWVDPEREKRIREFLALVEKGVKEVLPGRVAEVTPKRTHLEGCDGTLTVPARCRCGWLQVFPAQPSAAE